MIDYKIILFIQILFNSFKIFHMFHIKTFSNIYRSWHKYFFILNN